MKLFGNFKLGQWKKLLIGLKYTALPSLEIFGVLEVTLSYFTIWNVFANWKIHGRNKKD
jgi:hypothetical protein